MSERRRRPRVLRVRLSPLGAVAQLVAATLEEVGRAMAECPDAECCRALVVGEAARWRERGKRRRSE